MRTACDHTDSAIERGVDRGRQALQRRGTAKDYAASMCLRLVRRVHGLPRRDSRTIGCVGNAVGSGVAA
jgi:hypothetical protein